MKACSHRAGTLHGCSSHLVCHRCADSLSSPTERRSHCARYWPSWFLRPASTTHGGHDRELAQGERTACDPSLPSVTSHTSLFVGGASTDRALAPAHSSLLGQRTHRRAHAATSKLSTSDSGTSLRACLVKDSSTCEQCMLLTSAQGGDPGSSVDGCIDRERELEVEFEFEGQNEHLSIRIDSRSVSVCAMD
jgi:hypothetical protein